MKAKAHKRQISFSKNGMAPMLFMESIEQMNLEKEVSFYQSFTDGDESVFFVFFNSTTDQDKIKQVVKYINDNS